MISGPKDGKRNPSWDYSEDGEGPVPKSYNPLNRNDRRVIVSDFVYFQRRHGCELELLGQRGVTQQEKNDMRARYARENPDPT